MKGKRLHHDPRYPLKGFRVACRISDKFGCDDVHGVEVISETGDGWSGPVVTTLRNTIHVAPRNEFRFHDWFPNG